MELQLLVILAVAFILFGPEKMLEFATQLGKFLRKIKKEWATFQMELEIEKLKEELKKTTSEGEEKVKNYLRSEEKPKPKTGKEFLEERLKEITIEDLAEGKAPVVEDETKKKQKEN